MLQAYFDETGTHDQSELVAIVGLISTAEKWQAFDVEWRQLLSNVGSTIFTRPDAMRGMESSPIYPARFATTFLRISQSLFWTTCPRE
jgi:hypothetical protein